VDVSGLQGQRGSAAAPTAASAIWEADGKYADEG
jgi:hypothetical protein